MSETRGLIAPPILNIHTVLSPKLSLHRCSMFPPAHLAQAEKITTPAQVAFPTPDTKALGRHWVAEFIISDTTKAELSVNAKDKIAEIVLAAAHEARATVLNQISCKQQTEIETETGNIVSLVVIQESHLAIHYHPQYNFVFVDVFTCGEIRFNAAIDYISQQLQVKPHASGELQRGIQVNGQFVGGIGQQQGENVRLLKSGRNENATPSLGRHVIQELYACEFDAINTDTIVKNAFKNSILVSGGQFQTDWLHTFPVQGISNVTIGLGINAEIGGHAHLTIHTYPEYGYAAVDIFDSTQQLDMDRMLHFLQTSLKSAKSTHHEFLRGAYLVGCDNQKQFINGLELGLTYAEDAPQQRASLRR